MNILLITTDQQRWDTLGRLNPAIQTPNLDHLAARGILFEKAYTVNPVCTPSRCTMLTGQYPSRHGCYHVGTKLPEAYQPTIASQLHNAGYFTGLLGKAHFQPCHDSTSFEAAPNIHNLDFFRDWSGPYYGFEHAKLVIGHTSEPHGCGMNYGAWLTEQGVDLKKYFGIHPYTQYGKWELPAELHGSRWVAEETIAAVDLAQSQNKPFFLWASFQDPHNPYVTPEPWASMYAPAEVPKPALAPDTPQNKPPFYATLPKGEFYGDDPDLQDRGWGDCRIQPELNPENIQQVRAAYFGMVSLMDHHVGCILDGLAQRNLLDETLIVFTTDHGDYLGDHGLWGKGLPTYESMQRIPFIVSYPNCQTPGRHSTALQSLVDLEATFLNAAGLPATTSSQGTIQTPAWLNANSKVRDHAFLEFRPSQGNFKQHTWVTDRYKLVRYRNREYGELYDTAEDPLQRHNLFDDPAYRTIRDELLERFPMSSHDECVRERTAVA